MATKAQILANRLNSKKSTGPQTAEGKDVVSQNAVKHGLFAVEAVITGEDPADYEAYHDKFLAELAPVGMVEAVLAKRIISLSWRLQRAVRMQNQVIDDMIGRIVTNRPARRKRECYFINKGIRLDDPRVDLDHLPLGRIATSDWSNCRVLDRMFMYERRIENSMTKMMKELKRFQIMRRIEQQDADQQQLAPDQAIPIPINDNRDEAATRSKSPSQSETATRPAEKKGDLKKQSQFVPAPIGATSFVKGDYGNTPALGAEENKANQSQFLTRAALEGDQSIHCSPKIQG